MIYLNNCFVHALIMFQIANLCVQGKFRMKCIEKYDASVEDASGKFLDIPIDHRNLL